ncbi:2'-deoxycytidine 5'-triphosphate deaminase [Candidatus Nitrospira neomarina]|uniref:2'-deoxycytidine 5'-triphosphate deaminase n=1 Tax=Candidatus Nitrospira neomarina TaxID=3020899 RepID=A0AA96GG89_9BACT|nr:2'-deoxycytidine 5'-triphosphate deaminase [Candidatus Nitrospira neomarina]WNM61221.1 2'-deoxycytidine 5'-triphosphate deaminase [Candidatus Nitrospira neomarina]
MVDAKKTGILSFQHLRALVRQKVIRADVPITSRQIQPASLDLRLGTKAYRLLSSFLPEPSDQQSQFTIEDLYRSDMVMYDMDLTNGAILEKGHVYLVPLMERVKLPKDIRGRTNPKSSTGRLDIFTRVVTDLHMGFDEIRSGYEGPLFLEIVPRSFTIRVQAGLALNQLRLMSGKPMVSDSGLRAVHRKTPLLYHNGDSGKTDLAVSAKELRVNNGLFLSVDLQGSSDHSESIVGYRAKKNSHVIDLSLVGHYAASDFWEPLKRNATATMLLEPEEFYILASKERIQVPPSYSSEMVAYEAACGELRTHYAGFFDPGFGYANSSRKGTQVVLEVRPHDVPFRIHDGQTFFKVVYEKMRDIPTQLYGSALGSSYYQQGLTLSKHFKW